MRIKVIKPTVQHEQRLRVAAYARVSTDSLEQEDSLENQTAHFTAYIQRNPSWEFVGVYSDRGISGFKEDRPGFQQMIKDAKAGKIDLIIVKSISRFARNTETMLKVTRELKDIGVGVLFEIQNINTLASSGELLLTILAAFAQAESEDSSALARMTYKRKFEKGMPSHAINSFGLTTNEYGAVEIVESEAIVLRLIFDLAENGVWPSKIKQYLNEHGMFKRAGKPWNDTEVFRTLTNVLYKGDLILQKTYLDSRRHRHKNNGEADQWYISGNHPPIVSPEQWERVQEILRKRSSQLKSKRDWVQEPHSCHSSYPMTNMLFCPYCGKKLHHRWSNKGKQESWACSTHIKKGAGACPGVSIPASVVNAWGDIDEQVTVISYIDEFGMKQYTAYPKAEYEDGLIYAVQEREA